MCVNKKLGNELYSTVVHLVSVSFTLQSVGQKKNVVCVYLKKRGGGN